MNTYIMEKHMYQRERNVFYEMLATEICKQDFFMDPTLRKNRKLCDQGYQDIAKILGLSNADEVKKEIVNMKKYVHNKMRRCVRLSIIHGSGGLDAWNYAPDWFKQLEKPYNLLQTARKLELMNSFKYCRSGKRVIYFTSELTKCARSAAARELAKGSEHASRVLTSKEAVREYAETMDMEVDPFYKIWTRLYTQSLQKLMALIEVGDCSEKLVACKRLSLQDWLAVDTGLLYDISLKVVSEKCFKSSTTLNSLILLYKLMIAAHDKIRQIAKPTNSSMPHIGCQNEETGAQTGAQLFESSNNLVTNVASCSNATESILPDDTPLVIDEKIKEETVHKSNTVKKGSNEYETAEIWTLVHMSYTSRERSASVVLLQKRWHELKQHTRDLLWGLSPSPIQLTPAPILLALGKRFPYILIEKMPPWSELIRNNQVFLDSDLESYRAEYAKINFNLDVPKDIQEKILLDELNDWSDDDIEVISENKETIILSDTDDEQTNSNPDNNKKTNKNISEISAVDDECIKKLESIDPTTAKVKLIFEDDSDSDVNEFLNNDNDNNVLNSNFNSNHTTKSLDSLNNKKIAEPKHESEIISPDSNERGKYRFRLRYGNYSSDIYKVKKKISQPVCDPVDDEIEPVVNRIKDTRSGQSEVKKLIQNINDEVDDKLKYLRNNLISELNNESANGRFSNLHIKTETAEDLSINIKQEPCIQNSLASDVLNTNISVISNSERSECKLAKDNDKIGDETWGDQVADDDEHLSDTNIKEEPCIDNSHTSDVDKININAINDSERSESRLVTDNDKVGDEALGDQVTNVEHLSNTNIKQEPNIDNNYITDINISITDINDTERSESRLATDNDKVRDVVLNDKVIDDKHLSNSKIKQELHKDNSDTSNVNETNIATNNDSERSETKFATNNDKGDKATGDQVTDDDKHLNNTNIKHEPHKNNILITKIETSVTEINDLETSENSFANDNERLGDQVTGDKHLSKTNIKPEPYIKNSYTLNVNKTNISLINGVDGSESRLVNDNDEVCDEALGVQVADNDDNLRGEDYVDDKLVKLSCVILTPIEDTYEWETYSRNDIINCRRFSVRNFTRKHVLTSKELAKCRRYEPPKNVLRNGISAKKNREFEKLPKSLKERRHYLTRYLNLSRTCFSLEFWNERNIELLELCRPLSVRMNKSARVVKKIELADIDEVRRINRSILTAQVAPITVAANRMLVIDPMSTNNSKKSKPIQDDLSNDSDTNKDNYNFTLSYNHDSKLPAITLTILPNQQGDALIGNEMSSIKPKLCMDVTDNSDSGVNLDCNKPPKVSEVKDLIKNIVRNGDIPILPGKTRRVPTKGDPSFANKQKELERDIREISKGLMQRLDMTRKKRKEKTAQKIYRTSANANAERVRRMAKTEDAESHILQLPIRDRQADGERKKLEKKNKKSKKDKTKQKGVKRKKDRNSHSDDNKLNNVTESVDSSINSDKSIEDIDQKDRNFIKTEKELKRKTFDIDSKVLAKFPKLECNENFDLSENKLESDNIIDLCGDSDEENKTNASSNTLTTTSIQTENQNVNNNNETTKSQINIKIIQNTIEINGQCGVTEQANTELITFLSKVAGKIQEKNMATTVSAPSPNNSKVYYVVKTYEKTNVTTTSSTTKANNETQINTMSNSNISTQTNLSATPNPSPMFYVVKLPETLSGSTSVPPMPEQCLPIPVFQSISSLNQMPQNIQQFPTQSNLPIAISQGYANPIGNVLENLLQQSSPGNQTTTIVNPLPEHNPHLPVIQSVSYLSQMAQQNYQQSPNQPNLLDTTSHSINPIGNAFENLVKRPNRRIAPKKADVTPSTELKPHMPVIQSISSLSQPDQKSKQSPDPQSS